MQAEYRLEGVDITCDMMPVHTLGTPSTPLPRRWVYLRGCAAAGAAWDTKASEGAGDRKVEVGRMMRARRPGGRCGLKTGWIASVLA